ncbi:hypothetical protein PsorP6_001691 [Peronosclerospora sorghi]|uniref:Uncharacterized protein n=1 Tax=Peronosclerospora sorghi TaxID=230839 RepID=A0ACC0WSQ7_9STRA|nr:hypothetical protein PsorP6_001691 [Peronosclerospora sorghi]
MACRPVVSTAQRARAREMSTMEYYKDIVMSRLSGAPTFGRFEIVEQFPRNMFNMNEATQHISEDGTLQIYMPYYVAGHPLQYYPTSLLRPQDCFVW